MKAVFWWTALTLVLVAFTAFVYYQWETTKEKPVPVELPVPPASDSPRYPLPATTTESADPMIPQ